MGIARIKQGLILATLTTLAGGCSTWEGPSAKVEDRRVPGPDRSRTAATQASVAKVTQSPSRKIAKKPQPEERPSAKENTRLDSTDTKQAILLGARAGADVMSGDQVLDMKPERSSSR